jgi:hypothetical protein
MASVLKIGVRSQELKERDFHQEIVSESSWVSLA